MNKPAKVTRHGAEVWEDSEMDNLRRTPGLERTFGEIVMAETEVPGSSKYKIGDNLWTWHRIHGEISLLKCRVMSYAELPIEEGVLYYKIRVEIGTHYVGIFYRKENDLFTEDEAVIKRLQGYNGQVFLG